MKENGKKIKRIVLEFKNFLMEVFIRAAMSMESLKERVFINGVADKHTRDRGKKVKGTETAYGMVQTDKFMKDNGDKVSQTVQDSLRTTVILIKDSLSSL